MKVKTPIHTDIVLIGGGHSHVAVLKSFGMQPQPGVRLTLIARDVLTPYSGMLPGLVAGHYRHEEIHVDLQRLCRFASARLYHTNAEHIDLSRNQVHCTDRPPVGFDLLSLDIGSTPDVDAIPGAGEHALGVKPVDHFLVRWAAIRRDVLEREGDADLVTIGAGAGGVELTLSMQHRLNNDLARAGAGTRPRFHIVSKSPEIMAGHAQGVRDSLTELLAARGIEVHRGVVATAVHADRIELSDGRSLDARHVFSTTQASAARWLRETDLALDEDGFVRVMPTLVCVSHPHVFACGDVAAFTARPLPKSGVFAVRQGPVLADNLRRAAVGRSPRPYRAQRRSLALISTGDPQAIASYGSLSFKGAWVWRWKDWIDRRWMDKYQRLPAMDGDGANAPESTESSESPTPASTAHAFAMRCGGCGSKVASPVLRRVLDDLAPSTDERVLVGIGNGGDDAAVLALPPDTALVQSVDHFRTFIDDPYLFAKITTLHCLSDLFAMGAVPHSAQTLVSLPFATESKVEQDLRALLAGVTETLAEAGAPLVGGHTAEGPELSLGLAVNGVIEPSRLLRKGTMAPGDALILTKPLGTGVIFAADMRALAPSESVLAALAVMLVSNQGAASILSHHGASACTDITGFGLAGHLIEMLRAGALDARLDAQAIPLIAGAEALLASGIRSSLDAGNRAFLERVEVHTLSSPVSAALVDPQTSGGLLASVPDAHAETCLDALGQAGYDTAAIIGHVEAPDSNDSTGVGRIRFA